MFRVVSDRRSYGKFETWEEAYEVYLDLVFEASCKYSDEDFWIEEED